MCYDYELEYHLRRAEEARKEQKKAEDRSKPKPVEVPHSGGQEEPVPA